MARYVVEDESQDTTDAAPVGLEGLAVAKALALKKISQGATAVVVRDAETGEVLARYEPSEGAKAEGPSLAQSVRRMRAANDRLKEALVPPGKTKRS